jgi:predicted protein tyrosine phosphatase
LRADCEKVIECHSIGKFDELSIEKKNNAAVIRIFNSTERDWEEDTKKFQNELRVFFDDVRWEDLSWFERIQMTCGVASKSWFSKSLAVEISGFLARNQNAPLLVHCEYGKSRSVAVAKYAIEKFGYRCSNKTEKELSKANSLMLRLLMRV